MTAGYVVMRVGLVAMWLRAAREHPERRQTALRYAVGIGLVQVLWLARLMLPPAWAVPSWVALALAELAVPLWATRPGRTPWHAHHIAERYGLFTIIVLGECVLGASNAVAGVIEARGWSVDVVLVGFGSVSLILGLWWVYFLLPNAEALHHHRDRAFTWGYGHVWVFGSLAALGAFLGVVADQLKPGTAASGHAVAPALAVGLVAAATAVYLATAWWLRAHVTQARAGHRAAWIGAFAWLGLVVLGSAGGLPLPAALPLLALAPALVVVASGRGRG